MEETYSKLDSTQKIVVKLLSNCLQSVLTGNTVLYTCFNNWLQSVRLVLATQPCTLASTTGYRVYQPVPATQPCTLASTTGCRVYGWYWLHSLVHLLQQLVTECTNRYRLHSPVHLLQQLVAECTAGTGYTTSYTCFNNWLQSVPAGTNRVLATQSLLYSASPQLVTSIKKKKKKNVYVYRPVAVKFIGDLSLPVFCQLQRITGYSTIPGMESWYRTQLPKVNLVTEKS